MENPFGPVALKLISRYSRGSNFKLRASGLNKKENDNFKKKIGLDLFLKGQKRMNDEINTMKN